MGRGWRMAPGNDPIASPPGDLPGRPPSDAGRRQLQHAIQAGMRFDRSNADRRRRRSLRSRGISILRTEGLQLQAAGHWLDRSPVRFQGAGVSPPARLLLGLMAPRARRSVLRRRPICRERLAPTGNRAISDVRSYRLSKPFQSVIDRHVWLGRHPSEAWADTQHHIRRMRCCQEQNKN